jgi:tetratricopeptide (TPR) repeat protein
MKSDCAAEMEHRQAKTPSAFPAFDFAAGPCLTFPERSKMVNRRERFAVLCALILASCVFSQAPPPRAQDKKDDIIQEIGWEISTGNIESALADARRAVQEFPESAVIMHLLAVAQSKNNLQDEARASFNKSIRLDPTIPQNYYDLALLDMQTGDYDEAVRMLQNFLGISPRNAKAHLMLGIAYRKQGNDELAVQQLKQALAITPGLPLVHYNLGKIHASQGNNESALDEYREELGVNPEFYDVYWSAGDAEMEINKLDAAEALYRRGTEIKPLGYQAYYGLAHVYQARKQWAKAEAELQTVIILAPDEVGAHAMLASVYTQLGKTLEARREELVVETLKSQANQPEDIPAPSH